MRLWRTRAWCVHDAPGVSVPAGATAGAADNLRLEPTGAETGSIRPSVSWQVIIFITSWCQLKNDCRS